MDLIHFPTQAGFITEVPSIYQPWDLQHLHLPMLFSPDAAAVRERRYRAFCHRAAFVIVASEWAKRDLIGQYGLDPSKVGVIPVPPPVAAYKPIADDHILHVRRRYSLPDRYLFYPAQTWKHKNHLRLIEALVFARERHGVEINVVCSGRQNEHYPAIRAAVAQANLGATIRFVGHVPPDDVQALYRASRGLIFPSLFEGWGLPVVEAFFLEVPVACGRVTSLPDLAGDAAILFDPLNTSEIADAMWRIWTDESVRSTLIAKGKKRVVDLTWERTARAFRAHYRLVGGTPLSTEDIGLLARDQSTATTAQPGRLDDI